MISNVSFGPHHGVEVIKLFNAKFNSKRVHSSSVVRVHDFRLRGSGFKPTSITVFCPRARHINPCFVLVQPRKTCPHITEILLTLT